LDFLSFGWRAAAAPLRHALCVSAAAAQAVARQVAGAAGPRTHASNDGISLRNAPALPERRNRRCRVGRRAILAVTTTLAAVLLRQWLAAVSVPSREVLSDGLLIFGQVTLRWPIETIGYGSWKGRQ